MEGIDDDIRVHVHVTRHDCDTLRDFEEMNEGGIEEARIIVWKRGTIYSWTSRPDVNIEGFCWFLLVILLLLIVTSAVIFLLSIKMF